MKGEEYQEIWLERQEQEQDLLDVYEASIFYNDSTGLPDFPRMSSSSSAPAPAKPIASSSPSASSSSSASWAMLKSDAEEYGEKKSISNNNDNRLTPPVASLSAATSMEVLQPPQSYGDADCMDMMETFGSMELIESNEIWDPSSIFQTEQPPQESQHYPQNGDSFMFEEINIEMREREREQNKPPTDELGVLFFEWLKSNKESISAEDMRSIKLRRATVECASKRLGSTKDGLKQLLKLILEWVEQYQLQKKQRLAELNPPFPPPYQEPPLQNPNPNSLPPNINNPCCMPSTWVPLPRPPYYPTTAVMAATPGLYGGDPYGSSVPVPVPNYAQSMEYNMLDSSQTWPPSQYAMTAQYNQFSENNNNNNNRSNNNSIPMVTPLSPAFVGYGNQYQYYQRSGNKLVKLGSSATKEARKKRMARQRRFLSHHHHHQHHHHHHNHNQQNQHQNQNPDRQHHRLGGDQNCLNVGQASSANWDYWPNAAALASSNVAVVAVEALQQPPLVQSQNYQQQQPQWRVSSDSKASSDWQRQGWEPEMNLKFLLQKVLKQSDVGNLGRIVLPKKEAEIHLPELEARDGIPIAMEDIGTSQVWNMRYWFWPNNKSRMYLLENTGDFVQANGLQEGDFIVMYSDVKCGKYLIRGVKVRQPRPKSEAKKPSKSHKNTHTASPSAASGSSPPPSHRE
ncbi:B3 domain-containing transcription factor [Actinidia chinensis var. chinensis]|uniref:B3 domain-containing transcription factor n=1 Tax=Actinidia chinensis var. chinensis TaxID=1590841 RepID=A0A2R6PPH9_ACTCC|nr:B3 domain-containing transcription factor [Actinidia chinensis var. chinensis]